MGECRKIEELYIEITNHCVQKCIHCSSNATCNHYAEIPLENIQNTVQKLLPLGLKAVVLSGGEPFLHPDLFALVDFLEGKGIRYSLYTCGVVRGADGVGPIPEHIFKRVKSDGLDKIIFSLHAGTPATQARVSGFSSSFSSVLESIRAAKRNNIEVEIHVVPMRINYDELEQVLDIANTLGVSKVSFLRFVPQGRGAERLRLTREQFRGLQQLYRTYQDGYKHVRIRFGTPFNCITYRGGHCTAGINKVLINAYGEILPCEAFKYLHGQRPTIYQHDICEVWQTDLLLKELRTLRLDEVSTCSACIYKDGCQGGCPGQRKHLNGDFQKGPDPSCILM